MPDVDPSKGVWKVTGRLPSPDSRRMTTFVNADDEEKAKELGRKEGMDSDIRATFHAPEEIKKWESMVVR